MNSPLVWMATIAMSLFGGLAYAQNYDREPGYGNGQARTVRCESRRDMRNFCRIPTQGQVRLVRQLSRTACVRGRNWHATNSGIRVSNGCRAEFAVGRRTM